MPTNVRATAAPTPPVALVKLDSATFHGRHVTRGTEITVAGAGRCRFLAHVTNPSGDTWVDVVDQAGRLRSFSVDRVKTVHRLAKTRENG